MIVLGYPTCRSGRLHPVQRWRTEIGVRTFADVDDGLLIFSGGATRGADESEAAVMARHAVSVLGVPGDRVRVETRARSTWDNIRFSLPLTESADQIAVASDPLHADKALRYLSHQRPDMMPTVVRAADFQVLERWWLKIPMLVNYVWLRASGRFGVPPDAP